MMCVNDVAMVQMSCLGITSDSLALCQCYMLGRITVISCITFLDVQHASAWLMLGEQSLADSLAQRIVTCAASSWLVSVHALAGLCSVYS